MSHQLDEFSKSLAEPVPRRESLRRLGAVFAGALFGSLGLKTAVGAPKIDACTTFCKCSNKPQQNACLQACRVCNSDPRWLCGSCATGYACTDLASDPWNCGTCFNNCGETGPYEYAACIDGRCEYDCVSGAVLCNGTCTVLDDDVYNCGACGYACGEPGPYEYGACIDGECRYVCTEGAVRCDGACTYLEGDPNHCGACGRVCGGSAPYCSQGECAECPPLPYVALCGGVCVNLLSDASNCGACGNVCADGFACSSGSCIDPVCQFYDC